MVCLGPHSTQRGGRVLARVFVSYREMDVGLWGVGSGAGNGVLTVVRRRRELNLSSQAAAALRKASCRRISCSTSSTLLPSSRLCKSGSWAVSQASATTASWANWCTSSTEERHSGEGCWGHLGVLSGGCFLWPSTPSGFLHPSPGHFGLCRKVKGWAISEDTSFSRRCWESVPGQPPCPLAQAFMFAAGDP